MRAVTAVVCAMLVGSAVAAGAQPRATLSAETAADFDAFVSDTERMVARRAEGDARFLWADEEAKRRVTLRSGRVLVEPMEGVPQIRGGLMHVWTGAMFVPDTEASAVLEVLRGYERHPEIYPEVVSARVLGREGDTVRAFLRFRQEQALTVVLNTEHEASFTQVAPNRWVGLSRSTKIAEVENADQANERELPVGDDHGFLWRLNAYWRIEQSDDGVFVECLSVSLSRQIPRGLGFIVGPFVRKMPRRSLEDTLQATRLAILR